MKTSAHFSHLPALSCSCVSEKPVPIAVAKYLEAKQFDDYSYYLHLRSANLSIEGAASIAGLILVT